MKIVDKDFITSVGDFPQTETDEINRWDIVAMMQHMESEIKQLMLDMLYRDDVPVERVISWVKKSRYDSHCGMWLLYLNAEPDLYAYYEMLASDEGRQSKDLSVPFLEAHPMRVVSLYNHVQKEAEGYTFFTCSLSEFEMLVLIYSTGKLSVREIMEHVGADDAEKQEAVIAALKKMEKHKVLVFCEI